MWVEKTRCSWVDLADTKMVAYHDTEYGAKRESLTECFEVLSLEGFQSGLSWRTILHKREAFREVFFGFDPAKVARMTSDDVLRLCEDARIIRHRGKIEAAINNAKLALQIEKENGFCAFLYSFTDGETMSKALKKLGFKFVGPTTCTEILTVLGVLPAHQPNCFCTHE